MPNKNITINVVNLKRNPPADTIKCARPSPLGNPFPMKQESDRDAVCENYRKFYYERKTQGDEAMGEMFCDLMDHAMATGVLNIGCFCAPARCHLDTVKEDLIYELTKLGFTVS